MNTFKNPFALLGVLALLLLVACGGDGSTEVGCQDCEENGRIVEAASLDDLPECAADNGGTLAVVDGMYYACVSQNWEKVVEVARGICNVRPCDKALDGQWVYVYSEEKPYQCKSGLWKDVKGNLFDELEFVGCFMNALVQDTVGSEDDLKACTENKEGDIFVAGKNMVACLARKWVEIPGGVVSESDLPDCSGNGYIYVMGKMAVYQCKDGVWYGNGKAVTSSQPKSSSSGTKPAGSSSSEVMPGSSSSSGKPASSSTAENDETKVRGVCTVSKSVVEKGESVTYSFYNMGGTVVSYSWNFDENASIATSDASSPEVSYGSSGTYRAKLVLNKGRKSESDEIVCSGVTVEATPVTGCVCTTDATKLVLREGQDVSATWTVSGCSGEPPFTYEWNNGASGTGISAVGTPAAAGDYAPTLTVTNSDGGTMEPACKTVPVMTPVSASCSILKSSSGYYFYTGSLVGISDKIQFVELTLVSASDNVSKKVTASAPYFDYEDRYMWSWTSGPSVTISPSDYALYAMLFEGDTVCTAAASKCGPSYPLSCSERSMSWRLLKGDLPVEANSYQWTFTDKSGKVIWTSDEAVPEFEPDEIGEVSATLKLDAGLSTESNLTCSRLNVRECNSGYLEFDYLSDLASLSETLGAGKYIVNGCQQYMGEAPTWEYGSSYSSEIVEWFESSVTIGSDWDYTGKLTVRYPVKLNIPDGKSMKIPHCY